MKDLNNHIALLKKNFETLKKESSERYEKNISEIVDLENAKKELENIVLKVGPSAQTMHMLTKPKKIYDETHKTALGYQNPLYLSQARRKQPALWKCSQVFDQEDKILLSKFMNASEKNYIVSSRRLGFIVEVKEMKDIFKQMEDEVDQYLQELDKSFFGDIVHLDLQESNKSLSELRKRFEKLEEYNITLDIAF
ncbi:hypothetical protein Tco_0816121 [Tanacetum coccineum]